MRRLEMQAGLALLRTIVGGLFIGHGLQKLTGWFGGHGLKGTGEFFEAIELRPGVAHAAAAGAAEAGGGALVAAGLQTPLGAAVLSGTMITAIRKVHLSKGVWASDGGYEYNLVLLAIVFALSDVGPGRLSLDAARGGERKGLGWALAQLAAGAIGSTVAIELGKRQPASASSQAEQPGTGETASANGTVTEMADADAA
ncbi:MAG TPA: DoxX family protein [Solirubrobacteraceae bacterium]|nr:DoxX family protein [Solirubrobacteraceae bacterium]